MDEHNGLETAMKCSKLIILFFSILVVSIQVVQSEAFEVSEERIQRAESEAVLGIGRANAAVLLQGVVVLLSPELQQEIQSLADEISDAAECDVKPRIHIINDHSMNLFALPSKDIFIFAGFLEKIENLDELAFGLAHEIAHVCLKHGHRKLKHTFHLQYTGAFVTTLLASMASAALGEVARIGTQLDVGEMFQSAYDLHVEETVSRIASQTAAKVTSELVMQAMISAAGSYSQRQEEEADRWGMIYMKRAGYDPAAATTLMRKFLDVSSRE